MDYAETRLSKLPNRIAEENRKLTATPLTRAVKENGPPTESSPPSCGPARTGALIHPCFRRGGSLVPSPSYFSATSPIRRCVAGCQANGRSLGIERPVGVRARTAGSYVLVFFRWVPIRASVRQLSLVERGGAPVKLWGSRARPCSKIVYKVGKKLPKAVSFARLPRRFFCIPRHLFPAFFGSPLA